MNIKSFLRKWKKKGFQFNPLNLDHPLCFIPMEERLPIIPPITSHEEITNYPYWNVGVHPELKMATRFMDNYYTLIIRDNVEDLNLTPVTDERYSLYLHEDNPTWYGAKIIEKIFSDDRDLIVSTAKYIQLNFEAFMMERWM